MNRRNFFRNLFRVTGTTKEEKIVPESQPAYKSKEGGIVLQTSGSSWRTMAGLPDDKLTGSYWGPINQEWFDQEEIE